MTTNDTAERLLFTVCDKTVYAASLSGAQHVRPSIVATAMGWGWPCSAEKLENIRRTLESAIDYHEQCGVCGHSDGTHGCLGCGGRGEGMAVDPDELDESVGVHEVAA